MEDSANIRFTFIIQKSMPEVLSALPVLAKEPEWGITSNEAGYTFEVVDDGTRITIQGLRHLKVSQPERATIIDAIDFTERLKSRMEKGSAASA